MVGCDASAELFDHGYGEPCLPLTQRKTAADTEALRPIRRQEKDLREENVELALHHQNDLAAWEPARDVAIKKAGGDRASGRL